jgi:muconate cycloisomerase
MTSTVIARIDCRGIKMRTSDPEFKISSGPIPNSEAVFVRLADSDGRYGVGVGPIGAPLISGETAETASMMLNELVIPDLLGEDPFDRLSLMARVERRLPGNTRARCAIDLALWDWIGRVMEVPVSVLLGASAPKPVRVLRLLPMYDEGRTIEAAAGLVAAGYDAFKIKLGRGVEDDVRLVEAFRGAFAGVTITVDFNGRYSPRQAVAILNSIESHRVLYAEQPIPRGDLRALRWVRDRSQVAILADESAVSIEDIVRIGMAEAADAVSVKIGKFGGLTRTLDAISTCEAFGLDWLVGTTPAGQLIDAASGHLVSAKATGNLGEVGEFERVEDDPGRGLTIERGKLIIPPTSGFGVRSAAEDPNWYE